MNAEGPIVVTEFPMVTDWSDEQHWNAQMSIYLTEFEMVAD